MISLIVPTRNRPENLFKIYHSWVSTRKESELIIVTDLDDINNYDLPLARMLTLEQNTVPYKLNEASKIAKGDIIGFCGDDCIIETKQWEKKINESMTNPLSLVYVSDGHDRHNVPNHIFMSKELYLKIEWFAHPEIVHCYTDHVWRKIGLYLNNVGGYYGKVKDVVFKHNHPDYDNEVEFDEVYQLAYDKEQAAKDKITFLNYKPNFNGT